MNLFDESLKTLMNEKLAKLETEFAADVIFFYGEIHTSLIRPFRDLIEDLKRPEVPPKAPQNKLVVILNTPGGSAETGREISRYHSPPLHRREFCCSRLCHVSGDYFLHVGKPDLYGLFLIAGAN